MKCLTDNVYYEARGEPIRGQMLVARVTLNRAKRTGVSICEAVYAKGQFSWTATTPKKPKEKVYNKVAKSAYAALYLHSPVYYFHGKQIKPKWAKYKKYITTIGNHVFYA